MNPMKRLADELSNILKDQLLGAITYGDPNDSPLNLLIVLKVVTKENLSRMKAPIQTALKEKSIGIITMTKKELQQSADVFPIKFRMIQKNGVVLVGENSLVDLQIEDIHLRLRCEQELRNLSLRLRQSFLLRNLGSTPKMNLLGSCANKFEQNLIILAELKKGESDLKLDEVERILKTMNLNLSTIQEIRNAIENKLSDKKQVDDLYHKFREMVDLATNAVDQL